MTWAEVNTMLDAKDEIGAIRMAQRLCGDSKEYGKADSIKVLARMQPILARRGITPAKPLGEPPDGRLELT